ncbi:glutamine synthetase family protein [Methanobacterium sp. BAmetb5]|uniref:glutamine synthetase family protein n=1 Tax=Methanobacterium sp. BAmetb5 TaxID=2025351 RepID=UPI000E835F7B|nr:glutamine synthetase family protein [Methanobacterium sp. BAmetb5]AXV39347.1 MAG: glutamine synthetase [Methanobacterium sp. BAmetb5]
MKNKKTPGLKPQFIRVVWCDNANIIRGKAVHVDSVKDQEVSVGISRGQQGVPVMYDGVVAESGLDPVGEITLRGDMATLTPLSYAPGHFRVMGDMLQDGKVWENCPRGFLKKMIRALEENGLKVKASFENEFYLLKKSITQNDGNAKNNNHPFYQPADFTPFASTQSMDLNHPVIMDIVESLITQNITVEQYYPESGPGQQEITMGYSDALPAADNQVIFRETVKAIAPQHGLIASFLPKIFPDKAGSGCHLHLSLWKDDENILPDHDTEYGIGETAQAFIAGILHHLPALMALTTPIPRSYRRIRPHMWSGAFQSWGFNNREAAIRVIQGEEGKIKHFELKTVDAASNPYLALGAVIAAGLNGIQENMTLTEPVQKDPATLSPEERDEKGIIPLPGNLGEALEALRKDRTISNAMGPELSKSYLAVKNKEYEDLQAMHSQKEVELLLEKY